MAQGPAAFEFRKLGETASRVAAGTEGRYPKVPWNELVRLRHRLADEYFRLDPAETWRFIDEQLDPVARALSS